MNNIVDTIKIGVLITSFVLVMMLIIEYFNATTKGKFNSRIKKSGSFQVVFASILGLIPGCLGSYTAVSFYTHNVLTIGALVATLIATSGDEAFFMFSAIPETAVYIHIILFAVAIGTGYLVDALAGKHKYFQKNSAHFAIHEEEHQSGYFNLKSIAGEWKQLSFHRATIIVGIVIFILLMITGSISHEHNFLADADSHPHTEHVHHHHEESEGSGLGWIAITVIITSFIALFIVATVPHHFLEEHLWDHLVKKHLLKILLWTFGALIVTRIAIEYIDVKQWVDSNIIILLLLAAFIGLIPESGPHMVFITLFLTGAIPLSILVTSSIVQDGHGAIPLFAETKRSFFVVKSINFGVGLLVGGTMAGFGL